MLGCTAQGYGTGLPPAAAYKRAVGLRCVDYQVLGSAGADGRSELGVFPLAADSRV